MNTICYTGWCFPRLCICVFLHCHGHWDFSSETSCAVVCCHRQENDPITPAAAAAAAAAAEKNDDAHAISV